MSRIKGIEVILINQVEDGRDGFDHPVMTETRISVQDVLVSPLSVTEMADTLNLTGKKAVYQMAIPKGDTNTWKDQKVEFFGQVWQVIGYPKRGIEKNIPLKWHEIWQVAAYE